MKTNGETSNKLEEIAEIQRRIEYLFNTGEISISEKIFLAQKALKIIEVDVTERFMK